MDGYGYWIFLLILYGLSAFMKKRRQTVARRNLDQEEGPEPKSQFASKEDIFKELFGGQGREENEPEPVPIQQQESEYLDESFYHEESGRRTPDNIRNHGKVDSHILGVTKRAEVVDEPTDPKKSFALTNEPFIAASVQKRAIFDSTTRTTTSKRANTHLIHLLKNKNALKYSIMLREVLDKPRALRKNIR